MTKKFKLLLLDADVVIQLWKLGIWEDVVKHCDVHLARSIVDDEALFYFEKLEEAQDIDLSAFVTDGRVTVFELMPSQLESFRNLFGPMFLEKLHPGETESLAHLLEISDECRICSGDKIVYRVLGSLSRGDQGISLEEILQRIGMGRSLPHQFSQAYQRKWTKNGFREGIQGIGPKKSLD